MLHRDEKGSFLFLLDGRRERIRTNRSISYRACANYVMMSHVSCFVMRVPFARNQIFSSYVFSLNNVPKLRLLHRLFVRETIEIP